MFRRSLSALFLFTAFSYGGVVEDVRIDLAQRNFAGAQAELATYQQQNGTTPEYLEALSWMARGYIADNQLDTAENFARKAETQARVQLKQRPLDAEPHLPLAIGAALEVEAQVLAVRGQRAQAAALLRRGLATYTGTSIEARLQKNLNLLTFTGQPAPPLHDAKYLGIKPVALAQLKGSPVLLFFWAHWCPDCKAEGPIITQLRQEFSSSKFAVVAPTQLYGYGAGGEETLPQNEVAYIGRVWTHFYPGLQDVAVPISKINFNNYGASTTPTLVLLDKTGRVALYHPGAMTYNDLRAAIEKVLGS